MSIPESEERRKFLQAQIDEATQKYMTTVKELGEAAKNMFAAKDEIQVWQKAFELFTRDSAEPYHPTPVPDPSLIGEPPYVVFEEVVTDTALSKLETTTKTKAGVLRLIFVSTDKDLTFNDILKRMPKNLLFTITRDDLHRMMPRFISRKEVFRVGRGLYRYNPEFRRPTKEKRLFDEEEQE